MTDHSNPFETNMIFFRVGWMERYRGITGGDKISGGGSYVSDEGFGHEILNFEPFNHKVYGYVQPPGKQTEGEKPKINLNRLDKSNDNNSVLNILVVWVATSPDGGAFIVGWYKNATVFSHWQSEPPGSKRYYKGNELGYYVLADTEDVKLLTPDERIFPVLQTGKGCMGQSNIWYADDPKYHHQFRLDVLQYINSGKLPDSLTNETKKKTAQQPDPMQRQMVEKAAICKTTEHYKKIGYQVTSVEKDNLGWDLNAVLGKRELKLEVKGLLGSQITVELTPNEYEKMKKHKASYKLCIVSQALSEPILNIFSYSSESNDWRNSDGNSLNIEEIVSARCSTN